MKGSPIWHPFTQHGLGEPIPLVTHAEGAALFTEDGRRIVDAISSWWVTTHGHRNPRIMAAIAEQAGKLDQIIFAGWTHEPAETLARGPDRHDAGRAEPRLLLRFGIDQRRGRAEDGAGFLGQSRRAARTGCW